MTDLTVDERLRLMDLLLNEIRADAINPVRDESLVALYKKIEVPESERWPVPE